MREDITIKIQLNPAVDEDSAAWWLYDLLIATDECEEVEVTYNGKNKD